MKIIDFFKADSPRPPIVDKKTIQRKYSYWRLRVFYSIYIGYALFYFTRKSFVFAMPALIDQLGFDKGQLGILSSLLAVSYGVSKFFSGVISDKANLRYFMGIGLIMTGISNILFGFSSSVILFGLFLIMNGFFQGWSSPPCARLLTHWYSQSERGRWWGVWNTSHNIGGALIPLVCAFAIKLYGWRYAMHLPGLLAVFLGCFLINRIRDSPSTLGLPPIEAYRNDFANKLDLSCAKKGGSKGYTSRQILKEYVLANKSIWILALSFFFVYVIRTAINDWAQIYLIETKGFSLMSSASCVFWFEIGGIFGSLGAGWLSDTIFKGNRGPVNVLFSVGILVSLSAFWIIPTGSVLFISILMCLIGLLVFGPQMLIGMAAAEIAGKKASGSATGFTGLFAYMGAASAGYPFGQIIQWYGWQGFFTLLISCALIAVSMLLPLWNRKSGTEVLTS